MKNFFLLSALLFASNCFAQFQIGSRTITLNDPSRNRNIECEVYYPATTSGNNAPVANGQFPVVVFGHGFSMLVGSYENWWTEFVPEGYIFVLATTEAPAIPIPPPSHSAFGLDLAFVAEGAQAWNTDQNSPFFEKVSARTAVVGHSMGGGCSFLAAQNNPIFDCIVGMAPAETNPSAITAAADVTAPTLILSGTSDGVTPPANDHIPIYNATGSSCKYFVNIQEGSHCYFASNPGVCSFGEFSPGSLSAADQQAVSYAVCRPWFEYFLKDICPAWDNFQTALSTETDLGTIDSDCVNDDPVIADNNGTLESDAQPNYQWYLNGVEIPNADQQAFAYTQSGTYQVGTTILGNCPNLSNEIVVQITGIVEREINLATASNGVQITSRDRLDNVTLEWFDVSGKLMASQSIASVSANQQIDIKKPRFTGVKLLRLSSNQATKTWRLY